MLGGVCREDARHARVEAASQDSRQSGLLETLAISPLPRVLEVCLILRLIVGRVQIVAPRLQASLHDGEVLIRQGQVHHDVRLVAGKQSHQLVHTVGIHTCRLDLRAILLVQHLGQSHALGLRAAGYHHFSEHLGILRHLVRCHHDSAILGLAW